MRRAPGEFRLEQFFLALSDRTRLRLLNLMREDEVCVCFLVEVLECPQPTISRHLAYLRRVGLVKARKDGRWMHYQLVRPADAHAGNILDAMLGSLALDTEMQGDSSRLVKYCCAETAPANLQEAPRPVTLHRIGRL